MKGYLRHIYSKLLKKTFLEPCIVIYGDHTVFIENISKVYEIDECCVSVGTVIGNVTVYGHSLTAKNCTADSLNICGKISSCEIERRSSFGS